MKKDLIIGGCVTVVAAAGLYSGLRLFFKKPSSQKAGMTVNRDRIAVTIDF